MIILRSKMYSEDKEEEKKKRRKEKEKAKKAIAVGTAGGTIGAIGVSGAINAAEGNKYQKHERVVTKDSQEINEKLRSRARQMGINIKGGGSSYYNPKDDTITISSNNPATLAHELGHASMRKNRSHDPIGKLVHTKPANIVSRGYINLSAGAGGYGPYKIAKAANLGLGISQGYKAAKKEEEGDEKASKKHLRRSVTIPAALAAPALIQEAAASRKGLKYLRESGASEETMKNARRTLGHAFGTYAGAAAMPILTSASGAAIGYGVGKLKSKKKSKKSKKKDDED